VSHGPTAWLTSVSIEISALHVAYATSARLAAARNC